MMVDDLEEVVLGELEHYVDAFVLEDDLVGVYDVKVTELGAE